MAEKCRRTRTREVMFNFPSNAHMIKPKNILFIDVKQNLRGIQLEAAVRHDSFSDAILAHEPVNLQQQQS